MDKTDKPSKLRLAWSNPAPRKLQKNPGIAFTSREDYTAQVYPRLSPHSQALIDAAARRKSKRLDAAKKAFCRPKLVFSNETPALSDKTKPRMTLLFGKDAPPPKPPGIWSPRPQGYWPH